jgi:hypothetical protein
MRWIGKDDICLDKRQLPFSLKSEKLCDGKTLKESLTPACYPGKSDD